MAVKMMQWQCPVGCGVVEEIRIGLCVTVKW